jgi:hypothetical protein
LGVICDGIVKYLQSEDGWVGEGLAEEEMTLDMVGAAVGGERLSLDVVGAAVM